MCALPAKIILFLNAINLIRNRYLVNHHDTTDLLYLIMKTFAVHTAANSNAGSVILSI
jgi:hypothetical protein